MRALLATAAVAGLAAILEPNAYPSYDYAFALASAQDVLAGRGSGYEVDVFSPVPHPLTLIEALAVVPLGDLAFPVLTAVALMAFGLLCWSLFKIGCAIASRPVGILAAAVVFTSPVIFELAVRTNGDVVFAALVAAALALEVTQPRRARPVLAVLALAGLLRPEAWLLAGAYWMYVAPRAPGRERVALAALVGFAPVAWMASDALLTGDPFHSAELTRGYTKKAQASVSLDDLWTAFHSSMGWPVLAGALAGTALAGRTRARPAVAPLVTASALFIATVAPAVLGESPVLRRYLVVPSVVAGLFFAFACLGWTGPGRGSRAWRVAGVCGLLFAVAVVAGQRLDKWDGHRHAQGRRVALLEHLRTFATAPLARSYLAEPGCRPVLTPGYGYRPYLRFWLDVPPRAVAFQFVDASPPRGVVLLPTARDGYQRVMLADVGRRARANVLGAARFGSRFRLVARSAGWELYAGAACRRAVATRSGPTTVAGGASSAHGARS